MLSQGSSCGICGGQCGAGVGHPVLGFPLVVLIPSLIRTRIQFIYPRRCMILRTDSVGEFSVLLGRPTSQGVISQKSGNPSTPRLDGKKKKLVDSVVV